jgi:hypothetical protein
MYPAIEKKGNDMFVHQTICCLALKVLLTSAPTTAPSTTRPARLSQHQVLFHVHQAVGHLESWRMLRAKGQCLANRARGAKHLKQALRGIRSQTKHPQRKLVLAVARAYKQGSKVPMYTLEALRMNIHDALTHAKRPHPRTWHRAFMTCRKRPTKQTKR